LISMKVPGGDEFQVVTREEGQYFFRVLHTVGLGIGIEGVMCEQRNGASLINTFEAFLEPFHAFLRNGYVTGGAVAGVQPYERPLCQVALLPLPRSQGLFKIGVNILPSRGHVMIAG